MSLKNKKQILLFLAALLFLTLSKDGIINCQGVDSSAALLEIRNLPDNNSIFEVVAKAGQQIVLKIRANPTTGYFWVLGNIESLNEEVLKPLNINVGGRSSDYVVDSHKPGFVGVPGYYYFKFEALKAVNAPVELIFIHKRPWSDEDSRTAFVRVTIQ
jgi:predicted secreted protein